MLQTSIFFSIVSLCDSNDKNFFSSTMADNVTSPSGDEDHIPDVLAFSPQSPNSLEVLQNRFDSLGINSTNNDNEDSGLDAEAALVLYAKKQYQTQQMAIAKRSILYEILDSEKKYIEYLNILWTVYYEPILTSSKPNSNSNSGGNSTPKSAATQPIVSPDVAQKLLPNEFKTIRTVNNNLLTTLTERLKILDSATNANIEQSSEVASQVANIAIGDIFMKLTPFFKNYIAYNASFQKCIDTINKVRKTNQGT